MKFENGYTPWNKGQRGLYHHSTEVRKRMSLALIGNQRAKGRHHTEEAKEKIREANRGKIPWTKGRHFTEEHKRKLSEANKGHGLGKHLSEETRRKISEAQKGRIFTEETKRKISEAKKGNKNPNYGKHPSQETRKRLVETHKGLHHSEATKKKMSVARIIAMKNGCCKIRPTSPERKFVEICTKHNLPFKYVGDGNFWIENVNPDFVESNGRKIAIEIYGNYWHKLPSMIEKDKHREATLEKYGWKLLTVWEHELKESSELEIIKRVTEVSSEERT